MDRALMKQLAVKVLVGLIVSVATVGHADFPKLSKDNNLSYLSYGRNLAGSQAAESHVFYTDGTYCYMGGGGGEFIALGGKWQYKNQSTIDIILNPIKENYFAYWNMSNSSDQDNSELHFTQLLTHDKNRLLVGFGDDKPTQIAWYYPNKHSMIQSMPKNVKAVFIGDGTKDQLGHYELMRFSLQPKPTHKDLGFDFFVGKDRNSGKQLVNKNTKLSYQVKGDSLIFKGFGSSSSFDTKNVKLVAVDPKDDDYIYDKIHYDYCRSGEGAIMFTPNYPIQEPIMPIKIGWQGIVEQNPNWLQSTSK